MTPETSNQLPKGMIAAASLVIIFIGIHLARPFLILISIAAVFAFMIAPLVRLMRRYRLPEWSAILTSSLLLILPFISLGYVLYAEADAFIRDFPKISKSINQAFIALGNSDLGRRLNLLEHLKGEALIKRLEGGLGESVQMIIVGVGAVLDASFQVILVLIFSILMLAYRKHLRKSVERIYAQSFSIKDPSIIDKSVRLIEQFMILRLLMILFVGGVGTIILLLFQINYALLFGSILGVLTLVPSIGFLIGMIPPVIISMGSGYSFLKTLFLIGSLLVLSFIESNVVTPKFAGKQLNINVLMTFIGLFGGGLIWGMWGSFLSIPILGILKITFNAIPSLQVWSDLLSEQEENGRNNQANS